MEIKFTKMHGLGNDFVVIDAINQPLALTRKQIQFIADRHFGVGCDQLLLVEKPDSPDAEFRYRIFNADGGEVEQCGNGARCFAVFVRQNGLTNNRVIPVETTNGLITLIVEGEQVTVDMGAPDFRPQSLPFLADDVSGQAKTYDLMVNGKEYTISAVSVGNPHAVMLVDDVENFDVENIGAGIESHELFPNRVNAGFIQIISRDEIRVRVFERGVGETMACGTGACAAMVVGRRLGKLNEQVTAHLRGGDLKISWTGGTSGEESNSDLVTDNNNNNITMTGPATTVFQGIINCG